MYIEPCKRHLTYFNFLPQWRYVSLSLFTTVGSWIVQNDLIGRHIFVHFVLYTRFTF